MKPLERPEALRQSSIARFDACPLSLKFDLESDQRQLPGYMGQLAARGVLFHRFAALAIEHMQDHGEESIGVDQAMEILIDVVAQRDVPDEDVVSLPMREIRWLRVLATRWVFKNRFTIDRVIDVERRLTHPVIVRGHGGQTYERLITGKPDVLLAGPAEDEATVLDWKSGWAAPAKRKEAADGQVYDRLSDMGYVQQVVYGWLVMREYPSVNRVTEREYYVMEKEDQVREATVERWEMERIEDVLAGVVAQMDAAFAAGPRSRRWFPIAGTHCGTCSGVRRCPLRDELGIPETLEEAQRLAREWIVAGQLRAERAPLVKGWVDANGPIPIRHAKGRREVGWVEGKETNRRSFRLYEPPEAADSPFDPLLAAAAREAGVLVDV